MPNRRLEGPEALIPPLYLVAALLVFTPALDFLTSVLPFRVGNIEWRFASVGLLSGFLLTPILGIALAMMVAGWAGHARFQRVLAIVNLSTLALFLVVMVMFLLDIVQLRSVVQAEAKSAFEGAAIKAVVKYVSVMVAFGYLGIRGWSASRWSDPAPRKAQAAVIIGA